MLVKDMRCETPMCSECLSGYSIAHSMLLLCKKANVIAFRAHDDVSVRLLESNQHVHHFKLPLYDQGRVRKHRSRWVGVIEDRVGI